MISKSVRNQASILANRQLSGERVSDKEMSKVAESLEIPVDQLREAMAGALKQGVQKAETAGAKTAKLREATQGAGAYAGQAKVDLEETSGLRGTNLSVEKGKALESLQRNDKASQAKAVAQIGARGELASVPNVGDIEAMKVGGRSPADVAAALKTALLSSNPKVVKKAAETLRTAESYQRKAAEDWTNYAGTGFWGMDFPSLNIQLSPAETKTLAQNIVASRDPETAGAMMLASRAGLLSTSPADAFTSHEGMKAMWPAGKTARIAGSEGSESPNDRDSFKDEYSLDVRPGESIIGEVIRETAAANGAQCPFSRGNHAKGQSFDNGEFKLSKEAPEWAQDLIGTAPKGGAMARISTSATNPEDHDKEPAQTGFRLVIPIQGKPGEDGSSTWDVTCNTGSTTHRPNPREHTTFTNEFSVPRDGLAGTKAVRLGKYLMGGIANFNLLNRAKGIGAAIKPTKEAMEKPLHKQELFGRHTLFMGGRYLQVRYKVIDPTDFKVADPKDKDGQLDVKAAGIKAGGMKIAMYVKELPPGVDPKLVEKEGWTDDDLPAGMKFKEYCLGTTTFQPQESDPESAATKFFDKYAHIPGRQSQIARGVGAIGRGRSPVYKASEDQRHLAR